jgi:hypothetical protein
MGIYMQHSIRINYDIKGRQIPLPLWFYNLFNHEFHSIQCNFIPKQHYLV